MGQITRVLNNVALVLQGAMHGEGRIGNKHGPRIARSIDGKHMAHVLACVGVGSQSCCRGTVSGAEDIVEHVGLRDLATPM